MLSERAAMWEVFSRVLSLRNARQIAIRVCAEYNFPFVEPIAVLPGLFSWTIVTNASNTGINARIRVSKRTGSVVSASFVRR